MATLKDHAFLRHAHPKEVALHLRTIAQKQQESPESISRQLLHAIETELVPPMVYALWTSSCPDDSATVAGLRQSSSIIVRSSAIRNFRRKFRTSNCGGIWNALGGTEGILALLAEFSVIHVKEFCKAVARCSTSNHARGERQALVTELLEALIPGPKFRTKDRRPLLDYYARLAYACTPDFQHAWMDQKDLPDLSREKAFATNPPLFQQKCLEALQTCGGKLGSEFGQYSALLLSVPQEPHREDTSVTESMAFTVEVLENVKRDGIALENTLWLDKTLCSLLKRTAKRRSSQDFTLRVLDIVAHCIQYQPEDDVFRFPRDWDSRQQRIRRRRQYWTSLILLRQRDRASYEPKLTVLLRGYGRLQSASLSSQNRDDIETRVLEAKRNDRYPLLRWIVRNLKRYNVDIEDGTELKKIFPFSETLMLSLPTGEALRLLEKYEKHSPGHLKVNIPILERLGQQGDHLHIELLRLQLVEDSQIVRQSAQDQIKHYQEMTVKTGSQPVRAAWLVATFLFAMASRCTKTLREVLIWARQYSRDPKTVLELYDGRVIQHGITLDRLSGMQRSLSRDKTLNDIARDVRDGNEACLMLLETAILAQNEPSFSRYNWTHVTDVFRYMIQIRLDRVDSLQARLGLTVEELFSCVWADTLKTLLRAEELGLSECNKDLGFRRAYGPIGHDHDVLRLNLKKSSPATLRFMEELARRRESLWLRHRPSFHPVVTTLLPPWPRGLPIQDLYFVKECAQIPQDSLTFFEKRIRDIVFMPSEQALSPLPKDHEIRSAIDHFTDEYSLALRLYLSWCDSKERKRRLQAAWKHAIDHMSDTRLSPAQITQCWSRPFRRAGAAPTRGMLNVFVDPALPSCDDDTISPIEWHPGSSPDPASVTKGKSVSRAIDWFTRLEFASFNYDGDDDHESVMSDDSSTSSRDLNYWDVTRYASGVPTEAREAFIAAALLMIESRAKTSSLVLPRPFPSAEIIRFPALYLDADFLERGAPSDGCIELIVSQLLPAMPPTLLKQLAEGLLVKFQAGTGSKNTLRKWLRVVLGALALSDKPQLAIDLIVRVLIEMPDEDIWHRVLFHPGVLIRLSPGQTEALLYGLRSSVLERLERRLQIEAGDEASDEETQNPGPYMASRSSTKVTIVKDLARVLEDAAFIGEDFTLDTLVSLFSKATHIFIRAAVVTSLARLLFGSRNELIREGVLGALERLAVPIAAELNERDLMTEQRWRNCKSVCEPPVADDFSGSAPICSALLDVVKESERHGRLMHSLAERILLPLIQKSRENNTRWAQIFFRKHFAFQLAAKIPHGPTEDDALRLLLERFTRHMPAAEFKNFSDLVVTHSFPSQEIMDFTSDLKNDRLLSKGKDAQHWFHIRGVWDRHGSNISSLLLKAEFALSDEAAACDLVTPAHLQAHERRMFDDLLAEYSWFASEWNSLLKRYAPPVRGAQSERTRWLEHCKPLVQYALSKVEAIRTPEWQQNPRRQPSTLPDTFEFRVWLLDYPSLSWEGDHEERIERFAGQVLDVLQQLAYSGRPYRDYFAKLQKAVEQCERHEWGLVALHLGWLDGDLRKRENLDLADLLRVQMAHALLQDGTKISKDDPKIDAARDMTETWEECTDEFVRVKGIEAAKRFK